MSSITASSFSKNSVNFVILMWGLHSRSISSLISQSSVTARVVQNGPGVSGNTEMNKPAAIAVSRLCKKLGMCIFCNCFKK